MAPRVSDGGATRQVLVSARPEGRQVRVERPGLRRQGDAFRALGRGKRPDARAFTVHALTLHAHEPTLGVEGRTFEAPEPTLRADGRTFARIDPTFRLEEPPFKDHDRLICPEDLRKRDHEQLVRGHPGLFADEEGAFIVRARLLGHDGQPLCLERWPHVAEEGVHQAETRPLLPKRCVSCLKRSVWSHSRAS
jgi:hypothetical protein